MNHVYGEPCANCGHPISDHILHGEFGPDECEAADCDCRYYDLPKKKEQ